MGRGNYHRDDLDSFLQVNESYNMNKLSWKRSIHIRIIKPTLQSIIELCVGVLSSSLSSLSSDSFLKLWIYGQNSTDSWTTTCYDDGQNPRSKASKIQKLAVRCFCWSLLKYNIFTRVKDTLASSMHSCIYHIYSENSLQVQLEPWNDDRELRSTRMPVRKVL